MPGRAGRVARGTYAWGAIGGSGSFIRREGDGSDHSYGHFPDPVRFLTTLCEGTLQSLTGTEETHMWR